MFGGMYLSTTRALLASCDTAPGHIGAFVEEDLDDTNTLVARRLDARDIVHDGRHLPLMESQNAVLDVLRIHAA